MKRTFLLVALSAFFFTSCEKKIIPNQNNPNSGVSVTSKSITNWNEPITVNNIGDFHNHLMDVTYNGLQQGNSESESLSIANSNFVSEITAATNLTNSEYNEALSNLSLPLDLSKTEIINAEKNAEEDYQDALLLLSSNDNDLALAFESIRSYLRNNDVDVIAFNSFITDTRNSYFNTTSNTDVRITDLANSVFNISLSSYEYWAKNGDKWFNSETNRVSDELINAVISADVRGAVVGGTLGGLAGAAFGGIGAFPGALLGAGISAPVQSAARGILGYLGW